MDIQLTQSSSLIDRYDFIEVTLQISPIPELNPFVDMDCYGYLRSKDGQEKKVVGFCDADDGSIFRIRFMADRPGDYTYEVVLATGDEQAERTGKFTAVSSNRKGLVRVDSEHPFHFIWEGTGEHYFF
jgi:hypothetical protein